METTVDQTVTTWRGAPDWHQLAPRLVKTHLLETGEGAVVEVGVWQADLSQRILGIPQVSHLTLVDPWTPMYLKTEEKWYVCGPGVNEQEMDASYRITCAKMERYGDRVTILRLPSVEAARFISDHSLAVVIIDALHFKDQVIEDIEAWRPKLRHDGLMIGDDYSDFYPGVQLGVEAVFGNRHTVLGQTWWTYPHGGLHAV